MRLESLEGGREDDPVEVTFEQSVEFAATQHLAGGRVEMMRSGNPSGSASHSLSA